MSAGGKDDRLARSSIAAWTTVSSWPRGEPVKDTAPPRRVARSMAERCTPSEYGRRYTVGGPKGGFLSGSMREYGGDPVRSVRRWRDEYGDFVPLRFGPFRSHM